MLIPHARRSQSRQATYKLAESDAARLAELLDPGYKPIDRIKPRGEYTAYG
jgi:hypothetical protein